MLTLTCNISCRPFLLVILVNSAAWTADKPESSAEGIVNAASFAKPGVLSGGSIHSIFGKNLVVGAVAAKLFPLPLELAGTTVRLNGIAAPLLYVSPGQINFQAPSVLVGEGQPFPGSFPLVISTAAGSSAEIMVRVKMNLGLFSSDGSGCGAAAALNVLPDGTRIPNTISSSARPGDVVSFFGTGLASGTLAPPPVDGQASAARPLSTTFLASSLNLGYQEFTNSLRSPIAYAGRAPGFAGIDQYDVRIPVDSPEGCRVPVTVHAGSNDSTQALTISIRKGGGVCQEPPLSRSGYIRWTRTEAHSAAPNRTVVTERLEARLVEGASNLIPEAEGATPADVFGTLNASGPSCAGASPVVVDAGLLTIRSAEREPIVIRPSKGPLSYSFGLPPGAAQPGVLSVSAAGSERIGPFQSVITSPSVIFTNVEAGMVISSLVPFELKWSGATPGSTVSVRVVGRNPSRTDTFSASVPATAGKIIVPKVDEGGRFERFYLPDSEDVSIFVMVSEASTELQRFSAPNLDGGGIHEWVQVYTFDGIKIRSR